MKYFIIFNIKRTFTTTILPAAVMTSAATMF